MEEAHWMEELKKGSPQAMEKLVEKYQNPLFRLFLQFGEDEQTAQDLVQEVFLRLYEKRHQYREQGCFRSYLYQLAKNLWVDWRRGKRNFCPLEEAVEKRSGKEVSFDIQWALEKMPEKLRLVLVLKLYHNFKYEEIARILDIPLGTVKSRMAAAVRVMRHYLAAYREEK